MGECGAIYFSFVASSIYYCQVNNVIPLVHLDFFGVKKIGVFFIIYMSLSGGRGDFC